MSNREVAVEVSSEVMHDIAGSVAVILGHAELLEMQSLPQSARASVDQILDQSRRLSDILTALRVQQG